WLWLHQRTYAAAFAARRDSRRAARLRSSTENSLHQAEAGNRYDYIAAWPATGVERNAYGTAGGTAKARRNQTRELPSCREAAPCQPAGNGRWSWLWMSRTPTLESGDLVIARDPVIGKPESRQQRCRGMEKTLF